MVGDKHSEAMREYVYLMQYTARPSSRSSTFTFYPT